MSQVDRTISIAEFKSKCLAIVNSMAVDRSDLIITKRGKAIAKLVPFHETPVKPIFGSMAGTITITGDLLAPLDVEWSAHIE